MPDDCRCNVVPVLEAEAAYFRRLGQEEGEGPSAAFFQLQAEYLTKLAQRFRDGMEFAERMKAALERPA